MMMSHNYSDAIEKGRAGLAQLLNNSRMQDLISRYPVTDETRERIRRTDFSCDSTFIYKRRSSATIWPASFLAEVLVDKDAEIIKWFLLLYSVSSVRDQLGRRFLNHLGDKALSDLGTYRFYRYEHYDLYRRRPGEIASLVDGIIDVEGLIERHSLDLHNSHNWEWELLCQAVALFSLSAGYNYLEDLEYFPEKLLARSEDMPFILACSEYISLMTGEDYDVVLQNVLQDNGVAGCLDDIFLMMKKEGIRRRLEQEKSELEKKLEQKKESIRQQETEIDVLIDCFGTNFSESIIQTRISKCNDKEHRDILYKLESLVGKTLSFTDSISQTGLPIPFDNLIDKEFEIVISEKEIPGINTVENLVDSIVSHRQFIKHFVPAVQQGAIIEPLRDDDPYDLETRIKEVEMFYRCDVDRGVVHSIDDLKQFVLENDSLLKKIVSKLIDYLGVEPEDVTMESSFTNDLGADSLDSVELIMMAEQEFGIRITDEETSSISTVKDLFDIIVKKTADRTNS